MSKNAEGMETRDLEIGFVDALMALACKLRSLS